MIFDIETSPDGSGRLAVPFRGTALLQQPLYNKGTAFTPEERRLFGIDGLLPSVVSSMDVQVARVHGHVFRKTDPLEKYIGLASLQDRNECLFYRLLVDHLEELLPIVYTPTVGLACQRYSEIFRRGRGLWITPGHRGRIEEVLANTPFEGIRLIVVTDNERILGLGDQGAGGMGIPVGKLALYTGAAGIHPASTLPISLDVGTDNEALLADDLYIGWREPRLRGEPYLTLVEEFVQAVKRRFPKALLQWEDFKKGNAFRLLDRYRHVVPSFNDDIQGTAAVALAAVVAGTRVTGMPLERQRIVVLGAGAAGIGISQLLSTALQEAGLTETDRRRALAVLDSGGLLVDDTEIRDAYKRPFAWPAALAASCGLPHGDRDLPAVVRRLEPTVLIGTSGQAAIFDEALVRAMAARCERPMIFPLSNPTALSEATPKDLLNWTDGRALVATGSPFEPVTVGGRTFRTGQANNVFVFPGVGLGCLVAEAREVTDRMFLVASRTLAEQVMTGDLEAGSLLPRVSTLRDVAARVAAAVVREARDSGVGREIDDGAIAAAVAAAMWDPRYPTLVAV